MMKFLKVFICFSVGVSHFSFSQIQIEAELGKALTGKEPVSVLVPLSQPYDLNELKKLTLETPKRGLKIAEVLESHLIEQVKKETPWLKVGSEFGVEEVTPLWLVGAVRVRALPGVIEKLLLVSGSKEVTVERAKPVHALFDDAPLSRAPGSERDTLSEMGWGVQKIQAPEVWQEGPQGEGIVVAVLDSGVNVNHPDLAGNVWMNAGEMGKDDQGNDRSNNAIDDDKNGFVDDVYGWNFEENTNDVRDYLGHGTQSAGIIAGQGTNGTQTGVAPKANIMSLRSCCLLGGEVAESAMWEAIQYAMRNGARVISMSVSMKHWGNPSYPQWRRASEVLNLSGIVHVNSAGNRGKGNEPYNIGAPGSNPPAWLHSQQPQSAAELSSMITVGAVDFEDHLRNYSSVGPVTWETVNGYKDFPYEKGKKPGLIKPDICAPSETPSISSDGENYTLSFGGTSSATPHVAGVVALLLSHNPKLTVAQITEAIQMSADQVEGGFSNHCGAGRINALASLKYVKTHFQTRP
jgi:subtilisin family serine protease